LPRGLHTIELRHRNIHDDQIRGKFEGKAYGGFARISLADNLQAVFLVDKGAQTLPDEVMVFRQNNPHTHGMLPCVSSLPLPLAAAMLSPHQTVFQPHFQATTLTMAWQ
jgi:hypothetical protein